MREKFFGRSNTSSTHGSEQSSKSSSRSPSKITRMLSSKKVVPDNSTKRRGSLRDLRYSVKAEEGDDLSNSSEFTTTHVLNPRILFKMIVRGRRAILVRNYNRLLKKSYSLHSIPLEGQFSDRSSFRPSFVDHAPSYGRLAATMRQVNPLGQPSSQVVGDQPLATLSRSQRPSLASSPMNSAASSLHNAPVMFPPTLSIRTNPNSQRESRVSKASIDKHLSYRGDERSTRISHSLLGGDHTSSQRSTSSL